MRRTTPIEPTEPTEPTEPASPLSSPIKGRHAPGLTLYALGHRGIFYCRRHFVSFRGLSEAAVIFISLSFPCMVKYNSHTDMNNIE